MAYIVYKHIVIIIIISNCFFMYIITIRKEGWNEKRKKERRGKDRKGKERKKLRGNILSFCSNFKLRKVHSLISEQTTKNIES